MLIGAAALRADEAFAGRVASASLARRLRAHTWTLVAGQGVAATAAGLGLTARALAAEVRALAHGRSRSRVAVVAADRLTAAPVGLLPLLLTHFVLVALLTRGLLAAAALVLARLFVVAFFSHAINSSQGPRFALRVRTSLRAKPFRRANEQCDQPLGAKKKAASRSTGGLPVTVVSRL